MPTSLCSRIPLASQIQTLAVAEYLSFRLAAKALGVAQSSVSARVKALQGDRGILLFERRACGVRLTKAGRHFAGRIAAGVDQLRADRLDVAFVAGAPELPDCYTRPIWTEPLVAVLPEGHRLTGQSAITGADLVIETFLVRSGCTGPQVHDHNVLRPAGRPAGRRAHPGL